jgi:16S rRNA (cytosine967-C5)-methyltransferase
VKAKSARTSSPIAPARIAAFDLLLELRRKPDLHSDVLLRSRRVEALSALDKNLATALVIGVLRWQLALQQRIRESLTKSKGHLADPVQVALELGAVQLLLLDRIPAHAAIFDSVELTRRSGNSYAVGLVNAVLRKLAQSPRLDAATAGEASAAEIAGAAAHPLWMVERWVAAYGLEAVSAICRYDQLPPPTTIRLISPKAEAVLHDEGLQLQDGAFVARARRVVSGDGTGTRALEQGLARIQDEGSQLIAELAGHGSAILDCCAAPGGKTAILAERNPTAAITACDVSLNRLKAMQTFLSRQLVGNPIRFRNLDATELPFDRHFDLVLCDAPCSGTGTMARNPEIRHRITEADLGRQHDRQVRLLLSAMNSLREGGRLVYSTCSLDPEENESVVAEVLERKKGFHLLPWREQAKSLELEGTLKPGAAEHLFPGASPDHFLRILPGAYPGDGFFGACLTRD